MAEKARPPAVVLGLGYGGLNAARSLSRTGVEVHGVHRSLSTPAARSRFLQSLRVWDVAAAPADASVTWLRELGAELGRPVVIAMDDADALFLARHREELELFVRYPFVPHDLVAKLVDKAHLHELCRVHGAPTLRSERFTTLERARAFASAAGYPMVAKGSFVADPDRRITLIAGEAELLAKLREGESDVVLQEHLSGDGLCNWIFHGYFDARSRCVFGMTAVKLLQHPFHGGRTVLARVEPNEQLHKTATTFLASVGYRGIVDCDYRYDSRDDTYKLLDANPRVGANFRTCVDDLGTDVVRAAYLDLSGAEVPVAKPRSGRRWLLETDFPLTRSYVRAGALSTRRWLGLLRGVEELAWFSASDVGPATAMAYNLALTAATTAARRRR